ncbi:MAG TPA: dihydropteroate synthase [Phnomibacter sp.]|nr:dihydropteroate synthase [Phnomibacter sp.]
MPNTVYSLNCRGKLVTIAQPVVMGILNVTPDSFFEGSRQHSLDHVLATAARMLQEGAMILDIGGQSTRPGAADIGAAEETDRVVPAIEAIAAHFPDALISVDTFRAPVARAAVQAGAHIVNDVSGGSLDADMLTTVGELQVPYICMHMRGTPATMQHLTQYDNMVTDVIDFFVERTDACRKAGIKDVIIDPGFGFAKTPVQNFQLLRELQSFQIFGRPVLLGVSRKSTICKTLNITADEALNGTTVLNTIGLLNGASILRVHDVKEAVEAVKLVVAVNAAHS